MSRYDDLYQERLNKLTALREQNIDPYTSQVCTTLSLAQLENQPDQTVTIAGRIMAKRGHGKLQFIDLQDATGRVQLMLKADQCEARDFANLHLMDVGDIIQATGTVGTSQTGQLSVFVTSTHIVTKSLRPLPDKWHGLTDVEERYRHRYVDLLVNPEVKQVFLTRTKVVKLLRQFLDEHQFIEVETPVLQPLYGGALAKPFMTHHNVLDDDLYLRISDELYLKRLVVGGFDRVYEMSKDFRNEGVSREHNPEFTMLEFYWAYADYEKLMDFTEELLQFVIQNIQGHLNISYKGEIFDFTQKLPRRAFRDLIFEHLQIDINQVTSESELIKIVHERSLLPAETTLVGYGKILDDLYKHHIRPSLKGPLFLTDYPVDMIPLAKRKHDDQSKVATFQLVINGSEFLKAYNELNDPQEQRARWEDEAKAAQAGAEEYQLIDEDYLEALEYGMPPTAGWGMGIDRFVAFLTDQPTLKDVILFPTMKKLLSASSENQ